MATIYDIAKASGVSATTVSHVLNRTRYVSPEVTSRVMDAVEELGYEPLRQRNKSNEYVSGQAWLHGIDYRQAATNSVWLPFLCAYVRTI